MESDENYHRLKNERWIGNVTQHEFDALIESHAGLLAALEEVATYRKYPNDLHELYRLRELARTAIAKAKGENT